MSTRRWIRLDVGWEDSEWLHNLDGDAAGCWPRLLCLVKRDGVRGRLRRPSNLRVLAHQWRVPVETVEAMEQAALEGADDNPPALELDDGNWVVTAWARYQEDPTAKERMRRMRRRQKEHPE